MYKVPCHTFIINFNCKYVLFSKSRKLLLTFTIGVEYGKYRIIIERTRVSFENASNNERKSLLGYAKKAGNVTRRFIITVQHALLVRVMKFVISMENDTSMRTARAHYFKLNSHISISFILLVSFDITHISTYFT